MNHISPTVGSLSNILCCSHTLQLIIGLELRYYVSSDIRLIDCAFISAQIFHKRSWKFFFTLCPCVFQYFVFHKNIIDSIMCGLSRNQHFLDWRRKWSPWFGWQSLNVWHMEWVVYMYVWSMYLLSVQKIILVLDFKGFYNCIIS